jgi:2-acylglycerol O-acyltransferase 2
VLFLSSGFFLSLMGIADASRESCNNCLSRGPGSAILLVLGGAKESLDAHAHADYELTLHRKGFVKVALENHADLVPVFSFGEVRRNSTDRDASEEGGGLT